MTASDMMGNSRSSGSPTACTRRIGWKQGERRPTACTWWAHWVAARGKETHCWLQMFLVSVNSPVMSTSSFGVSLAANKSFFARWASGVPAQGPAARLSLLLMSSFTFPTSRAADLGLAFLSEYQPQDWLFFLSTCPRSCPETLGLLSTAPAISTPRAALRALTAACPRPLSALNDPLRTTCDAPRDKQGGAGGQERGLTAWLGAAGAEGGAPVAHQSNAHAGRGAHDTAQHSAQGVRSGGVVRTNLDGCAPGGRRAP